jgi:hypothetical protein
MGKPLNNLIGFRFGSLTVVTDKATTLDELKAIKA